jgi:hypothetical protein
MSNGEDMIDEGGPINGRKDDILEQESASYDELMRMRSERWERQHAWYKYVYLENAREPYFRCVICGEESTDNTPPDSECRGYSN